MGEFEILGTRLKELRKQLNMNQNEFAEYIGISASTLSAYEIGAKNPSIGIFKTIAEKCHVSIDWLCGLTERQNYSDSIKCYADLYRMFFDIEKKEPLQFQHSSAIITDYGNFETYPEYREMDIEMIYFEDKNIVSFMNEWKKMKTLHDSNTIDDDVYNLWKEKVLLKNRQLKEFSVNTEIPFN